MEDNTIFDFKNEVRSGSYSLIIVQNEKAHRLTGSGVRPLLAALDEGLLKDSIVIDKVVGKAAAMIVSAGGARHCFSVLISEPACERFNKCGVAYSYDELVPRIINRKGDGLCPMESAVMEIEDDREAVEKLRQLIMRNS